MNIKLPRGKYVLAVSGGVDSMVLLDLLAKKPAIEIIAAHFNHGIRAEAHQDEAFVKTRSKEYDVRFEADRGRLGKGASEEAARKARYGFLNATKVRHNADGIITAHHQDDLIETALLSILRGTRYKGMVAMRENKNIIRPLLNYSKQNILVYAKTNNLQWREDHSNLSNKYLRNRLRNNALKNLSSKERQFLISNIDKVANNDRLLNVEIANLSRYIYENSRVNRQKFINLPFEVGNELISFWLREFNVSDFDQKTISRLNTKLRTSKPGSAYPVKVNLAIKFTGKSAQFIASGE